MWYIIRIFVYMSKEKLMTIAEQTLFWCYKRFGTPLKRQLPKIRFVEDRRYTSRYGDYNDRVITIYLNACNTPSLIIGTVIHEYTHFLQMPRRRDIDRYHKLSKKFNYNTHPFEIEAEEYAKFFAPHVRKILQ